MARKQKALRDVLCANCGNAFQTASESVRFCPKSPGAKRSACAVAFARRSETRGKVVMPYLMAWLEGRGGGNTPAHPVAGWAMKEMTQMVRDFIDEDRAEGRPPSTLYAETMQATGTLYIDRRKS